MYIVPNSIIRCLSGVPIDSTYRNTLWWNSAAEQETYFFSKSKVSLGAQSYQRANRGYLKIGVPVEQLYDCNYLMFQNTSFGNKWFYAFITNVEYINNTTTRVQYQLDVMQTWFFDYTIGTNFVSREHIAVDTIGANLIPEGLETGEYVCEATKYGKQFETMSVIIAATFDANYEDVAGGIYGSLYTGVRYHAFPLNTDTWEANVNAINAFIDGAISANKQDGILALSLIPTEFVSQRNTISIKGSSFSVPKYYGSFGGYTPKNNKLYTYPYNFLFANTKQGLTANFRYEDFSSANCVFNYFGDMSPSSSCVILPLNYKGVGINWNEAITITGFPQLSYNVDAYKAYMAQSLTAHLGAKAGELISDGLSNVTKGSSETDNAAVAMAKDFLPTMKEAFVNLKNMWGSKQTVPNGSLDASTIGGATAVLGVAGALGGFEAIYNDLSTMYAKQTQAPQNRGSNNSALLGSMRVMGLECLQTHIKSEFAQSIDGFFSMFGYATHKLKVPNRNSRPHWNYVQLKNTHIEGGIPFEHESAICGIYDRGITFWKNPAEVGHYELDNRPV